MRDLGAIFWARQRESRFGSVSDAEGQFVRNRAILAAILIGSAARLAFDQDPHVGSVAPWVAMPLAYLGVLLWGRSYYRSVGGKVPGRVLLVEDDPDTAALMKRVIESRGWTVDRASTLAEASTMIGYDPRWVVLDVTLPDGSGLGLVRMMRANHAAAKLMIVTGTSDHATHAEIVGVRPDAILYKPVEDPTSILNTLGDPFE